jgi:hypothetical protein
MNEARSLVRLSDRWQLPRGWRLDVDAADASDAHYLRISLMARSRQRDLPAPRGTRLSRRRSAPARRLAPFPDARHAAGPQDRPYAEFPRITAGGHWNAARGLRAGFDSELAGFTCATGVSGLARHAAPRGQLRLRAAGTRAGRSPGFTTYSCGRGAGPGQVATRSLPILASTPFTFERDAGSRVSRRTRSRGCTTLRSYRDKSSIPVFDTAARHQYHGSAPTASSAAIA